MIFTVSQLFFCFLIIPHLSNGADTLAVNQSLSGNQTLVSLDGHFELGFFKPGNSSNYYIGIWYNKAKVTNETVVWVANRDTPVSDILSSKLLIIDGNLVLLNESNTQIWSTNMSSTATPGSVTLLDDGNLVLRSVQYWSSGSWDGQFFSWIPEMRTSFLSAFPENEALPLDEAECRSSCLDRCICNAYTFNSNKCHHWNHESLDNISLNLISYDSNIETIYIKVFTPDDGKNNTKALLVAGIVSGCLGLVFLCSIGVIFYRRMKSRGQGVLSEEDRKALDIPFFEFKAIASATDNFSLANKLGQGGFGPVYKGTFPGEGEVEMAVKRLSSQSRQGLKEFKNEVLLIAKLQHRNLIRLLGYGMKNQEMILLYEYMPNKSLDRFIFDRTLCMRLDWALRFDIIMGIARGLLYLHQDSRLRIIHRDLKASNVLLDKDMNPKISDFGLAKIVKGKEGEGSLTRVVGTYGYMAPEYALNGSFSVKSDVFSFGVVVLEIISGKRNTGYYKNKEAFSLISYAWGLWKERKPLNLLDTALAESYNSIEVLRCLLIGLLCVQEDPQDRPTMTGVLAMLGMDIESLPDPKEPAFVSKKRVHSSPSIPEMRLNSIHNLSYIDNDNESYLAYHYKILQLFQDSLWTYQGSFGSYRGRGTFDVCNEQMLPFCSCLTDFEPRSLSDWNLNDFSGGCVRKTDANCKIKKPKFVLSYVRTRFISALLENEINQYDEAECRSSCLDYCPCNAYTFISNKCHHWNHESLDNISLNIFSYDSYLDKIYIKVFAPDDVKNNTKVLLVAGDVKLV
ncbi:hypothetical protein E3N88_02127 [Mikania micrantha]|uniref:non-specific serine/threonine protein kinase n=1 Tax=Mikania micrantha TaxID=192012 RepID=A0A5N6Q4W5_9ASTR|nr:hypothetical protein E3N88_02127 [Mikania micrantha]